MPRHSRDAQRRAYAAVRETCPEVSSALSELANGEISLDAAFKRVKAHGTELLRDALIEAYEEVVTLEGEVADLREQVKSLKSDLDTANDEIAHLSAESTA